ncbi:MULTISPECIES: ABC transporter ATP-binding protein [unclassified Micromonospora]|uniref:ABC transporter ATP-binding protein n=1 Tax=unclassified Micromonospora TaxID=2617518 RepID=UPI0033D4D5FC
MALIAEDLSFSYRFRGQRVIEDLTWQVPAATRTILLGPNGAGKSTLLRLLAGIHRPRKGRVFVADEQGRRTDGRGLRRRVAWMPQDVTAIRGLTVLEQITYAGWLGGLRESEARRRALAAVEQVALAEKSAARAETLSGGQLRRLGLAEALVLQADFLLLDEPTAGLDPVQRANFRRVLLDLPSCGLVVSTHQIDDIADVFDRVAMLVRGKVVFDGSEAEFHALSTDGSNGRTSAEQVFASLLPGLDH